MGDGRDIVIGIDQGTTNTKVVAIDAQGRVLGQADRPIASASPQLGWVEQDPNAMLANIVACLREVMAKLGRGSEDLAGLGIANQTETLVIWDRRTGEPVLPAQSLLQSTDPTISGVGEAMKTNLGPEG